MSKFFRSPNDLSSSSSSESGSESQKKVEVDSDDDEEGVESSNSDLATIASRLKGSLPSGSSNSTKATTPPNALVPLYNGYKSSSSTSSTDGPSPNRVSTKEVMTTLALDLFLYNNPLESRAEAKRVLLEIWRLSGHISPSYHTPLFQTLRDFLARKIFPTWVKFLNNLPAYVDDRSSVEAQMKVPNVQLSLKMPTNFEKLTSRYEEDFEQLGEIDKGGFGKVYECKSRIDKQLYAIKKVSLKKADKETCEKMLGECVHHARFQHPNVVRYHNAWLEFDTRPANSPSGKFKHLSTTTSRPFANSDVIFVNEDSLKAPSMSGTSIQFQEMNSSEAECASGDADFIVTSPATPKKVLSTDDEIDYQYDSDDEGGFDEDSDDEGDFGDDDYGGSGNSFGSNGSLDSSSARRKGKQIANLPIVDNHAPQLMDLLTQPDTTVILQCPVLYIQMELCKETLRKYLDRIMSTSVINTTFNEKVVDSLLSAVAFLHRKQVIHRDIKPSNVFIKHQDGHEQIVLGDFGLARNIQEMEILKESTETDTETPTTSDMTKGLGTVLYAAPEQLSSNSYTFSVDIYSIGVMIYEMYNKFGTTAERFKVLQELRSKSSPSSEFEKQWPKLAPIINSMVSKSANRRPSANDLLTKFKVSRVPDSEVDLLRAENARLKEKIAEYEKKVAQLEKQLSANAGGDSEGSH